MKVALIQCPAWGTYDPPLALAQLSSCLKEAGHEVFICDLNIQLYRKRTENYKNIWAWEQCDFWYDPVRVKKFFEDNSEIIDTYLNELIYNKVDVVGFSVSASSYLASMEYAKRIKKINNRILTVFGGTLFFEKRFIDIVLSEPSADIVVAGEGEITFCELLEFIEYNKDIVCCKGIAFKRENKVIVTEQRQLVPDLDSLPLLDFNDLPIYEYDDSRHIPLMTSRGCVLNCAFCSSRSFWLGYRTMSGERIFKELEFQIKKQNKSNPHLGHVDFVDLLFNGNMKSLVGFCELMIKAKLDVAWTANMIIRPEMAPDVIEKIKEARCEHVLFGIESGSPNVLKRMKKNYNIKDADRVIRGLHEAGIVVTCNFMFGFPGEREEDFRMTLDFINRNAKYIDRVYPSRTFCAIEEFSYLAAHLYEFDIKPNLPNHLYWETSDGKNTYPDRLRRCEEFCNLASSLKIEVGCGVQTSVELDRWFNLSHYYEHKGDFENAIDCFLKYNALDAKNEVILSKINYYTKQLKEDDTKLIVSPELKNRLNRLDKPLADNEMLNLKPSIKENNQRRFTWNIHYDCNYRCPYCFFEGKWEEYKKRNVYFSADEWLGYWNRIYENYGRCYILITGGEPFIYPNFIDLIERLSLIHHPINISTNASGDLDCFVRKIDPDRISLSVSFQPNFDRLEPFLEKVKFLRKYRFNGCINFVAYPSFIKDIEFFCKEFDSIGEKLKVIPFWGRYQNKEYPLAYTKQEREIIGIDSHWFNKVRKKDSICPAGYNSALVFPDGKVSRCGQIGESMLIGNFFDPEFKLLNEKLPCNTEFCPCDEDRLFGDKEEQITVIAKEGQIENRQKINSQLNAEEYSSGKVVLESSPKTIFIQAAGACNSNCVFCSRGSEYEIFDLEIHHKHFEKNLYPFISKAETLVLTGSGEFLQLAQAKDILNFFDYNFPEVDKCFSTNGSSLVPGVCEKIVNCKSKYTIHVSLHASNASLHKVLTRTETFHKILGQVKYLLELRKNKGSPKIHLIFVATTLNIEDFPNFIRLAASLRTDKVICYYNYIYSPAQKYLSCYFKQELTNRMLDEADALANKLNIEIALPPRFGQKEYLSPNTCSEAWSQIMFDSNGHVLPCDVSEDCTEILSNDKGFMDIWNGSYYQRLRKSLLEKSNSCFNHCFRANPSSVDDFRSHVIHRGKGEDITELWGDNF